MARDVFQEITDSIAAQLEQGIRPWAKPWNDKKGAVAFDLPHNIEGRNYRGANVWWLLMVAQSRGYESPVWMTFNQMKDRGGRFREGQGAGMGTPVFFWSRFKKTDKVTGEEKGGMFAKMFTVWNLAQIEGIELPTAKPAPVVTPAERNAAADALMVKTGADIRHGGNVACYVPSLDFIRMPEREQFMTVDGYYSTAFHEIGHWTGAASRLKREYGKRFGDNAYAFEELVAELTAAFVCASQGFASIERPDHAAYIGHWMKVLKADKKAFASAAGAAQRAADLILGTYAKAEEEPSENEEATAMAQAA